MLLSKVELTIVRWANVSTVQKEEEREEQLQIFKWDCFISSSTDKKGIGTFYLSHLSDRYLTILKLDASIPDPK